MTDCERPHWVMSRRFGERLIRAKSETSMGRTVATCATLLEASTYPGQARGLSTSQP